MTPHQPNKPHPGSVYLCIVGRACNCWGCGSSPAQNGDAHDSSFDARYPLVFVSRHEPEAATMPRPRGRGQAIERATMEEFVGVLTQPLQSPVLSQTGLTKRYDFVLDNSPPDMAGILVTALNEKLGLNLESKKAPIEILVIDRMEKIPTEN